MQGNDRSLAVAQIVAAILNKGERPPPAGGRPSASQNDNGFKVRLDEGKVCLFDCNDSRITLEELIQYVARHLP